jgi:hypothetical protein
VADRLAQAEAFLQEAVYRSRAGQAAGASLAGSAHCGLGNEAAVELELSERGAELFRALWPEAPGGTELERVREVMRAWIVRQDALDRDRNHFMKGFRQRHGFDRTRYSPEQLAEYEAGLEQVNATVNGERRRSARALLGE